MNREGKKVVVAELKDKFQKCQGMVFADFIGMNVNQMEDLRGKARDSNVEIKVVKNTLAKRAYDIFEDQEGLSYLFEVYANPMLVTIVSKGSAIIPQWTISPGLTDNA